MEDNKKEQAENEIQDLTREQRLDIEERAIQALIDLGVKFSVPLKITPSKPSKWILWWNKMFPGKAKIWRDKRIPKDWSVTTDEIPDANLGKIQTVYQRNFFIKPLYLGTIDYLRKLYLNIEYDEATIQDQPIQESKKLFKYIPLVAEIAAVAVINDPCIKDPKDKRVKELKKFFIEHLSVKRLEKLSLVISQMMNAGGFTSSIRSIKEIGTTKPRADLIEISQA